tara:strand:- start:275 stop:577 length:303 start_codon:yes stop_codon:yes gene_type:complete
MKKITLGIGALSLVLMSYSQDRCKRTDVYTRCENRVVDSSKLCSLHTKKPKVNKHQESITTLESMKSWIEQDMENNQVDTVIGDIYITTLNEVLINLRIK